jgi:hypothetical protein
MPLLHYWYHFFLHSIYAAFPSFWLCSILIVIVTTTTSSSSSSTSSSSSRVVCLNFNGCVSNSEYTASNAVRIS